jgi:threo-3-hydroxy-L-aspartate ammonia-lyase
VTAPATASDGSAGLSFDDVLAAAERLRGVAHRTPVLTSSHLDTVTGGRVHLKGEHLQRMGAFKFRGAYNAISALDEDVRAAGVIAFSSGNHAQAVALSCRLLGVPATIVMPRDAPPVKLAATRGYGADVVLYDRYTEDRAAISAHLAEERGGTLVPPFDHPLIAAGQGTAALELLEEVPDLDLVVAPIGGGGLLSGTAVATHGLAADAEVVGAEPATRRAARDALAAGEIVEVAVPRTFLDGQQTTHIGVLPLATLTAHGVRVVGVTDEAVGDAVRLLAARTKQLVEPSGAAALAAVLGDELDVTGRKVGVVLSGGNVAPDVLARILAG